MRGTRWRDIEWVDFSSIGDLGAETEQMPPQEPESEPALKPVGESDKFGEIFRRFAERADPNGRADIPGLAARFARVPLPRPVAEGAAPAGLVSLLARLAVAPPPAARPAEADAPGESLPAAGPEAAPVREPVRTAAPETPLAPAETTTMPAKDDDGFPAAFLTPVESADPPSQPSMSQTFGAQLGQAGAALRRQRASVGTAVNASLVRVRTTLRSQWPTPALAQLSQAGAALRRQRESMGIAVGDHLLRARAALRTRLSATSLVANPAIAAHAPPPQLAPAATTSVAPQASPPRVERAEAVTALDEREPQSAAPSRLSVVAQRAHATALRLAGNDPERLRRWLTVTGTAIVVAVVAYAVGAMIAGLASSDSRRQAAASRPAPSAASSVPVPNAPAITTPPQSQPSSAPAVATPPTEPVARAAFYLARAKAGDAAAQYDIGVLYTQGSGLVQDYASAASWFHAAAAQGIVDAQYNLGVLYERGLGVAANPIDAVNWYRSAADQNNTAAQYNLAIAYTEGRGTEQDLAAAARWYRRAAQRGLAPAMFNLAIFYERGQGVGRSPVDAYAWYAAAAERGYAPAKQRAAELLGQFSDQDKAKAQGLAATIAAAINGAPPA